MLLLFIKQVRRIKGEIVMKKMQLLLLCTLLSFAQSIFADGLLKVWNRSNMPIVIGYSTDKTAGQYSSAIAPGVKYEISYLGSYKSIYVYYLITGSPYVSGVPTAAQLQPDPFQMGLSSGSKNFYDAHMPIPGYIVVYGDANTAANAKTAAPAVAAVSTLGATPTLKGPGSIAELNAQPPVLPSADGATKASGQFLLPQGSFSRFIAIVQGTLTSETDSSTVPVTVQSIGSDNTLMTIAYSA